ncbi:MAG: serpin family protein, partial [Endomicrobium sp.]|nr:serpin family protein [Endomicrobium sp.]
QSAAKINKWIKQNSFKNGVPEVSEDLFYADTRAVLLNICEFEGKWLGAFDKNGSVEDDFFISGKDKTTVKLLRQEGSYYYYDNKRVQVLKMEFDANSSLSMIIILPKQNKISFAEQFLFKKTVPQIISLLSRQNAVVYVPEFQTASFLDLADALYYAGVQTSDYSKMSDSLLQVSNFLHYSSIQIDYEMKAAPSAVIEIDGDVGKIERDAPPVVFRADHPFIYAIIDESGGEILLMGKMLNPSN